MIVRCRQNYAHSKNYYDRGITVCDEWAAEDGANKFAEWAYANGYQDDLTLDRIDNDKGYSPDNCRWANMKVQSNNRRSNVFIEINGETKTLKQWSEFFGLKYSTVTERRRHGWDVPELFAPVGD